MSLVADSSIGRKLLATNGTKGGPTPKQSRHVLVHKFYVEAQQFQLVLWTSVALIFITYFIVAALFNLDYGIDDAGLYSRYKTSGGDDHESKSN